MPATSSDWDEKHRREGIEGTLPPAPVVRELLPLLPAGPALDLACGCGRHALLLAEQGFSVTAADWSPVALEILEQQARAGGVEFARKSGGEPILPCNWGIEAICADLQNAILPDAAFSLILCIHYLERGLMPSMARALRPGGMLLFETYTTAQLAFQGGPRNPAYLLAPGELRECFPSLEFIFYRELKAGQGIASLLARKPWNTN